MKILGMNKKVCRGLWVVYTVCNNYKYFYMAYRTKEKAEEIAARNGFFFTYIPKKGE